MWNERYNVEEYIYGTEPNDFLREQSGLLTGRVLSLAEGEGRNGVFLASLGLQVLGVDGSEVGLAKAQKLAAQCGVVLDTQVVDLADFSPEPEQFDAVVSIFAHLPSEVRAVLYPRVLSALKPGGLWVMESYSLDQMHKGTGGPKDSDMLMSAQKILDELPNLEPVVLQEIDREVNEGTHHCGLASVVQFVGRKPLATNV